MSHELTTFKFHGASVRAFEIDGIVWFAAADLGKTLGYDTTGHLTRLLDGDQRGVHKVDTPGGEQDIAIVSEPGMYRAVMRSRRSEAKAFERWVTGEVLPAIRKTGRYTPEGDPVLIALEQALVTRRAQIELEKEFRELESRMDVVEAMADTDPGWVTIIGACNLAGVSMTHAEASVAGRRAAMKTRASGTEPRKTHSQVHGLVGLYPKEIAISVVQTMKGGA